MKHYQFLKVDTYFSSVHVLVHAQIARWNAEEFNFQGVELPNSTSGLKNELRKWLENTKFHLSFLFSIGCFDRISISFSYFPFYMSRLLLAMPSHQ